jgi:undecaprenyl-diphosphatase
LTILDATLLGLLQGIAEFLPISSSGHLVLAKRLFGLAEVPLLFDVILHVATLAAVVLFFRKRIARILVSLYRWVVRRADASDAGNLGLAVAVIVGTLFTGVIGVLLNKLVGEGNIKLISVCFIATAVLLVVSEQIVRRRAVTKTAAATERKGKLGLREGVFVGIAQGIGVLPGLSRSGVTISASLAVGVDREDAGEFSFLLSIPAILGAFILELKDADTLMTSVDPLALAVGCAVAFVSGFLALHFLLRLIKRGKLSWFAVYLVPLGIMGLMFL